MVIKNSLILLPLMLLVLLVFLVASSDAVPASRIPVMLKDDQPEAFHESHAQDAFENGDDSELLQTEALMERRMDIETTDYPGTGANNHHDPRTPGGV